MACFMYDCSLGACLGSFMYVCLVQCFYMSILVQLWCHSGMCLITVLIHMALVALSCYCVTAEGTKSVTWHVLLVVGS